MIAAWWDRGGSQVSAASVAVFRIGFGVAGLVLVARFFIHGWIDSLFLQPEFHFKYPGFEWVGPWPGWGMYLHFGMMGLAAFSVAAGFRTRIAAAVFAACLLYVELIDRSLYLNHYYWMILSGMLFIFLPMGTVWSIDSFLGRQPPNQQISLWVVRMLRFQVGMVYVFAGLAKLNGDWVMRAEPLATWLPARSNLWMIGPLLAMPASAFVLSWAGALFDLTIVAWLSIWKTRVAAFCALCGFHLFTWVLFPSIGVFPLLMTLGATIFFEPDWPRRLIRARSEPVPARLPTRPRRLTHGLAVVYIAAMVFLPLRHHLIPGDVKSTGDGYLGSWQVMLSEKSASAQFILTDGAGRTWAVPPPDYLTERQISMMATSPELIRQVADRISTDLEVSVAADVAMSINGRPATQFTDPGVTVNGTPTSDWLIQRPDLAS